MWCSVKTCTRKFGIDCGHRVLGHKGKCRYPHGHRYTVEVTVEAPELDNLGMVMDFGDIKEQLGRVLDSYDHGFIVYEKDRQLIDALGGLDDVRLCVVEVNPTAENLAQLWAEEMQDVCKVTIQKVKVWETPNCYAEAVQNQRNL